MFFFKMKFETRTFIACFLLLNILSSSTAQDPTGNPTISNSVATHICKQQGAFQESSEIQTPVKAKPEGDDVACGWYSWSKCEDGKSESESDGCPSFVLEPCEDAPKAGRKGKGIALQKKQSTLQENNDACENSTVQGLPDPQIVEKISKYPSVVSVQRGDKCQAKFCTGLILNENWILVQQTGCMYQYRPEHSDFFGVVAGERRIHVDEETEQKRSIAEVILHPGLAVEEGQYYRDNIGLIRLSEPLELNENVQPIDLAAIEALAPSVEKSMLTIVGWLKAQPMKEDEEILASLIESPLDYVPFEECADEYIKNNSATQDIIICAGQCVVQGDEKKQPSRNILYARESEESAPVPIGIGPVRFLNRDPKYGVFTKIATYIPWIKEAMEGGGQSQGQGQGQTTEDPESGSKIIGGEESPPHKYPSIVNMEGRRSYVCTYHSCGGIILSEEWFVTAAHCVDDWKARNISIVVGDHDITDDNEGEQRVLVSNIIEHENWNYDGPFDIAVVKVTPPFKFNDNVQKVKLPDPSYDPTGPLMAVGWGNVEDSIRPHILKNVELPVFPLEECQKLWVDEVAKVGDTQICAGDETHGICYGDSGGPLYVIEESGEQVLVGLSSMRGSLCPINLKEKYYDPDPRTLQPKLPRGEYQPDVFTHVARYVDWIRKNAELGD